MTAHPHPAEPNQSPRPAAAAASLTIAPIPFTVEKALEELMLLVCEISAVEHSLLAAKVSAGP